MYMECSCSFVCSIIRTDINCRNSSRIISIQDCRATILSMVWRMARNTVFTLRVCGVLLMSVNPCEMSDTQTKAVFVSIFANASSKPSSPLTLQKVKRLDCENLLRLVRSSKNDVASQLKVSLLGTVVGCCGVIG